MLTFHRLWDEKHVLIYEMLASISTLALLVIDIILLPFASLLCLLINIFRWLSKGITVDNIIQRTVLISGCDSGFGHDLAKRLADLEIPVYAGCFTESGVVVLQRYSTNIRPFLLDITSDSSVRAAFTFISKDLKNRNEKLWAIVNNAGYRGAPGPIEWMETEDFQKALEVNCVGHIRVILTFMPLILQSKGRVIVMISMLGHLPIPGAGPYVTSKFAIHGFAEYLRLELAPKGVKVITISPGFYLTQLVEAWRDLEKKWNTLSEEEQGSYPKGYINKKLEFVKGMIKMSAAGNSIDDVIDAYVQSIIGKYPKSNYWLGRDSTDIRLLKHFPEDIQVWHTAMLQKIGGDPDIDRS